MTPLALVLSLAAGAASSQGASTKAGESMTSGGMSQAAAEQIVAGSGYGADEAQPMTINEIAFLTWGDDRTARQGRDTGDRPRRADPGAAGLRGTVSSGSRSQVLIPSEDFSYYPSITIL